MTIAHRGQKKKHKGDEEKLETLTTKTLGECILSN